MTMASIRKILPANIPGEFFVDRTCIDCGTCAWLAPDTFADRNGFAYVWKQPSTERERIRAHMSVLSCPVGAIGSRMAQDYTLAEEKLPEPIDRNIFYCGYHSSKSYGAASYLIHRPEGNILVDSPRFARPLVKKLEDLGGVDLMFLTHKDDVADHERFHGHFGCRRILHEADLGRETASIEIVLRGDDIQNLAPEIRIIPVPGHTAGSCCLLWKETVLFTGDHLSWDPGKKSLHASKHTCWHDWSRQIHSMKRLSGFSFEWVLPGHGTRCHLPVPEMNREMEKLIGRMTATS